MSDTNPLEARLRELEARVARLEARGAGAAAAAIPIGPLGQTSPPPPPAPIARPVVTPDAVAPVNVNRPVASPPAPSAPGPSWTDLIADLEERLTGRALAVVGGVALVAGAIFFLSLAFSRGWIGPEGRVLIGIGAAGIALALGAWMLDHRQPIVGRVLVAVGLAVVSLALFAATRLYGLVPVEVALAGSLVAAIVAAFLAVRHDAEIIAVLALIAVLAAPPVLGAAPNALTIAYLGTVFVGFAALSLFRTWRLLPSVAFLLGAPQVASWLLGDVTPGIGLVGAVAFWTLNAITAGGEEYLRPTNRLRSGSATLLVANAAFVIWAGFTVLDGPNEFLRGPFLVALAIAHAVIGGWFLLREGDRHSFGLLAAGTGVAVLAMAVPVQAGGPAVPIAWAAEAVALAWLASRRAHPHALLAAAVLGAIAYLHLIVFEYPAGGAAPIVEGGGIPFVNPSGLTLLFLLGSATLAGALLRGRMLVALLAAFGVAAILLAAPHELDGPALIAAWVGLALGALALDRFVVDGLAIQGAVPIRQVAEYRYALVAAAGLVAVVVLGHALAFDLPLLSVTRIRPPDLPFSDTRAATIAILVLGAAVSGWIQLRRISLEVPTLVGWISAALLLVYGSLFELHGDASVVLAAGLAAAGLALTRVRGVDPSGRDLLTIVGIGLISVTAYAVVIALAPPSLLTVANQAVVRHPPFISSATVACAAIAASLGVGARVLRARSLKTILGLAAGTFVVYGLSIGVVDLFQGRIPGPVAFEEVAKQAQVAMSVLWIVLGTVVFVFGLARRHLIVRQAGLVLLAIASLKVFAFDLAALDVAYRVLSLVALGVFLLLTAWVYARLRPPAEKPADASDGSAAAG